MARTDLPVQTIPFQGSLTDLPLTAGDATNDHEFTNDGSTLLYVDNAGASPCVVDVISVPDEFNRTGDEQFTVAAGEVGIAGPFIQRIWDQSGAKIHVDIDQDSSVSLAAVKFSPRK